MLEALARKCGIHIWRGFERSRFEINPVERELYRFITLEWVDGVVSGSFFASERFKYFVQNLDEWALTDPGVLKYFGGKSLMTQSHGQSLLSYFQSRYKIRGIYFVSG